MLEFLFEIIIKFILMYTGAFLRWMIGKYKKSTNITLVQSLQKSIFFSEEYLSH